MKKKVLILYSGQFGYHTDLLMYAKHSNKEVFDVHVYCVDYGFEKINIPDVKVHYLTKSNNNIKTTLRFILNSRTLIKKEKFDIIFQLNAKYTLFYRFLNLFAPMILDIRTGNFSENALKLFQRNSMITFTTWFYKRISVISESLANELKISKNKRTIIPLGGELLDFPSKYFKQLNLLYIGSLNNRNIDETVIGFSIFVKRHPNILVTYDIIGYGNKNVEDKIISTIQQTGVEKKVIFHGRKTYSELAKFLEKDNIGVVYVPQKRYYDFQPATKLFESVLAGMPVIATNTYENRISVTEKTGVVCEDNPESFANALETLWKNQEKYNSDEIKETYKHYDWKYIVSNIWEPHILKSIENVKK